MEIAEGRRISVDLGGRKVAKGIWEERYANHHRRSERLVYAG